MDRITLQNYRCFGSEEQSARLAPLTLLVGPNSTGKTSFLALIRALWDVAFREVVPNFREHPYDLGSFEDIVHTSGSRKGRTDSFVASFGEALRSIEPGQRVDFLATFSKDATAPFPIVRRFVSDCAGFELSSSGFGSPEKARYRIIPGDWQPWGSDKGGFSDQDGLFSIGWIIRLLQLRRTPDSDSDKIRSLLDTFDLRTEFDTRPFASSPVRSQPRRTYDPIMLAHDAVKEITSPATWLAYSRRERG